MRIIRISVTVLFILTSIAFLVVFISQKKNEDTAVTELHKNKPDGVDDIYTPDGIKNPVMPTENDDIYNDHTTSPTWKPTGMNEREEN